MLIRLLGKHEKEITRAELSLKEFHPDFVTRKAYNVPLIGKDCYLRATVCVDMIEHQVDVSRINLSYEKGIFVPNEDYFAADFLNDEWMELVPKGFKPKLQSALSTSESLRPSRLHSRAMSSLDVDNMKIEEQSNDSRTSSRSVQVDKVNEELLTFDRN